MKVWEGNCGHKMSNKEAEDFINVYIPHNKQQNSQVKKFIFFLSSITTTLDSLLEAPPNSAVILHKQSSKPHGILKSLQRKQSFPLSLRNFVLSALS